MAGLGGLYKAQAMQRETEFHDHSTVSLCEPWVQTHGRCAGRASNKSLVELPGLVFFNPNAKLALVYKFLYPLFHGSRVQ